MSFSYYYMNPLIILILSLVVIWGLSLVFSCDGPLMNQGGGAAILDPSFYDSQRTCNSNLDDFCRMPRPIGQDDPICTWWKEYQLKRKPALGPVGPGRAASKRAAVRPRGPTRPRPGASAQDDGEGVNVLERPTTGGDLDPQYDDKPINRFPVQLDGYGLDPFDDPFKDRQVDLAQPPSLPVPFFLYNSVKGGHALKGGDATVKFSEPESIRTLNSYTAPEFTAYDPDYYLDPSSFCLKLPRHRLCPNHWLANGAPPPATIIG